jgi:hypothetical protein
MRALLMLLVVALASASRADGLGFVGGVPQAEHVVVALTPAQKKLVESKPPHADGTRQVELVLTREQRALITQAGKRAPRWVLAMSQPLLQYDCTCGLLNGAVLGEETLAVLTYSTNNVMASPGELSRLKRTLLAPEPSAGGPRPVEEERCEAFAQWEARFGESAGNAAPGALAHLAELRKLARPFPRAPSLSLPPGWKARRIQTPRLVDTPHPESFERSYSVDDEVPAPLPGSLAALRLGAPTGTRKLDWPASAALEKSRPGETTLLLPSVMDGEIYGALGYWTLARFVDGQAVASVSWPMDARRDHVETAMVRAPGVVAVSLSSARDGLICPLDD